MRAKREGSGVIGVKKAALLAAAAATALGLSACHAHPGTAATINGVNYSDAQVAQAAEQFTAISGRPVGTSQVVAMLPSLVAYEEAGAEAGVTFTTDQVEELVDALVQQGQVGKYQAPLGSLTSDLLSVSLIMDRVMKTNPTFDIQSAVTAKMAEQDAQVNPRYGTIDPMTGGIAIPTFADVVRADTASQGSGLPGGDTGESGSTTGN